MPTLLVLNQLMPLCGSRVNPGRINGREWKTPPPPPEWAEPSVCGPGTEEHERKVVLISVPLCTCWCIYPFFVVVVVATATIL